MGNHERTYSTAEGHGLATTLEEGGDTGEGHCPCRVATPAAELGEGELHFRQWRWQHSRVWAVRKRKELAGDIGDLLVVGNEAVLGTREQRLVGGDELYL